MIEVAAWRAISQEVNARNATLVAVSKTKPVADIQALYDLGQRDFGENYVQELSEKATLLPADIRWHFIGHLQRNKVKLIAPFVHLIHGVDSFRLLEEINKQAEKQGRVIDVLLQMHVAQEETKFGLDENELNELLHSFNTQKATLIAVRICGLMGMASNSDDESIVRSEFEQLHQLLKKLQSTHFSGDENFRICSMGMSGDYKLAMDAGSNMVRIGSLLFGAR
jgi:pyridoxal phosphate enzyme (YggS family)